MGNSSKAGARNQCLEAEQMFQTLVLQIRDDAFEEVKQGPQKDYEGDANAEETVDGLSASTF